MDLAKEMFGAELMEKLFAGIDSQSNEALKRALQSSTLQTFESSNEIDAFIGTNKIKLKARCTFESIDKTALDAIATQANHQKVANLFRTLSNLESSLDKLNDLLENKAPSSPATLEPATEASKTSQDIVPVSLSMDKYFSNLFFASYQAFNELSENTKTDEISFNGTYFVIRGRARLNADSQSSPALYFLRIGIRGDNDKIKAGDKIFVIGYLIPFPFGDNIQDVRTAMSMVSGFKILR